MKTRYAPLALACALMVAGSAHAASVTLDFNDLATDEAFSFFPSITTSSGFKVTNDCTQIHAGTTECLGVRGRNSPFQADPGNAAVIVSFPATITTVKRVDSSSFDLQSIDLSGTNNGGLAGTYVFTFVTSGGSTQETVSINGLFRLQTFVFDKTQLISFSIAAGSGNIQAQFDNVVLNTAAVPELETYALMLVGLSAIGLMAKRRKV